MILFIKNIVIPIYYKILLILILWESINVPLLSLEETFRYSKLMFGETQYINGLVSYYLCIGNYRMLNQKYLSSYTKSDIDVIKAYVHKKTVEKLNSFLF